MSKRTLAALALLLVLSSIFLTSCAPKFSIGQKVTTTDSLYSKAGDYFNDNTNVIECVAGSVDYKFEIVDVTSINVTREDIVFYYELKPINDPLKLCRNGWVNEAALELTK
jgi:hypothetical protein